MNLPERLAELYPHLKRALHAAGVSTADRDARLIIKNNTAYQWADIVARGHERVADDALERITLDAARRVNGEPISRIYGERQFWGLDFKICEDTLDPRPDTETLIDAVLNRFAEQAPQTILDLGTGSGCILIALLSEYPEAEGYGIDKSLNALKTARENAQAHNMADRAHFYCGSWAEALKEQQQFDLILSNPPYIPNRVIPTLSKTVQKYDPILALDGGDDGLDAYKVILQQIKKHLNPQAGVFLEIGCDQEQDLVRLVEESGLLTESIHRDLAGLPRVVEISRGDK